MPGRDRTLGVNSELAHVITTARALALIEQQKACFNPTTAIKHKHDIEKWQSCRKL